MILVAWNGKQCDLKWLWVRICQAPNWPYGYGSLPLQGNRFNIDSDSIQRMKKDRAQIYLGCGPCLQPICKACLMLANLKLTIYLQSSSSTLLQFTQNLVLALLSPLAALA